MQIATIEAEKRDTRGTRAARRLRRVGKAPAIIYGHGEEPENITVPVHDLNNLLEHGTHLVELRVAGGVRQVLIKDVQYDHLGISPIHVDFARVDLNERVKVSVPLEFRGTPVGVQAGGLLDHDRMDLEVECLVTEIPASIRVNVTDLKLGDTLHVSDIEYPPNVTPVTSGDLIVCSVRLKATEEVAAPVEGEAAQPEIIGRKEKEEEEPEEEKKK